MKRKIFFLLSMIFVTSALGQATEVLGKNDDALKKQPKETIRDTSIVFPEEMERNYDELLLQWRNKFVPSLECNKESDENIIYADSVYTHRLYALPTIMEMPYNQITRTYIDMYTNRRRSQVEYMLAIGKYYFPIFEKQLDKHGLPLELKYLPVIESALNPVALSRMGASGLWQFMAPTGKMYGLEINSLVDERRDPIKSTEAAVRYLKDMYQIYGDWNLVIAAYNCGPGNVNKAIRRSGGKKDYWEIYPYLPKETRGYVPAFIAANYVMNYYSLHNLCPMEYSYKQHTDTVHVTSNIHLQQVADILQVPIETLREMNPQFKMDIIPGIYKNYAIVLPLEKAGDFVVFEDSIRQHRADELLAKRKEVNLQPSGLYTVTYHTIKRGETISQIARRYGVTVNSIKSANKLRSNKLIAGKRLTIRRPAPVQKISAKAKQQNAQREKAQEAKVQSTINEVNRDTLAQTTIAHDIHREDSSKLVSSGELPELLDNKKTENEPTPRQEYLTYIVKRGDTLEKIARKYSGVTINKIKKVNNLTSDKLRIGQSLKIPKQVP